MRGSHWHFWVEVGAGVVLHDFTMTDWMDRGACRDVDPELFFPVGTGVLTKRQAARAKTVCRGCPVRLDCLRWVQHHGLDDGVWGGLDPDERRKLRQNHTVGQ